MVGSFLACKEIILWNNNSSLNLHTSFLCVPVASEIRWTTSEPQPAAHGDGGRLLLSTFHVTRRWLTEGRWNAGPKVAQGTEGVLTSEPDSSPDTYQPHQPSTLAISWTITAWNNNNLWLISVLFCKARGYCGDNVIYISSGMAKKHVEGWRQFETCKMGSMTQKFSDTSFPLCQHYVNV